MYIQKCQTWMFQRFQCGAGWHCAEYWGTLYSIL